METRRWPGIALPAVLAVAVCACGSNKDDNRAAGAPEAAAKELERRQAERLAVTDLASSLSAAPTTERAALLRPGLEPEQARASEAYVQARATADRLIAASEAVPEQVFEYVPRWRAAGGPLRALASEPKARAVADLVMAGAGRTDGAGPEGEAWQTPAAVVLAHALQQASAGQSVDAAWKLLALARLGQDLARGTSPDATADAVAVMRPALAGLRSVMDLSTRKTLSQAALGELLVGCQTLRETMPSFADVLEADRRGRIEALVALYGGDAPAPGADEALHEQVEARGGVIPYLELEGKRAAAVAAVRESDAQPGPTRLDLLKSQSRQIGGDAGDDWLQPDALASWMLVDADLTATCIAIALEHDRRSRRKLAPGLNALAPKSLAPVPDDPIGQKPFEYASDGLGGRVLRSMPVEVAGKAVAAEVPVQGGNR